jgi:hypothetical protein
MSYTDLDIFKCYSNSPYLSIKHSTYFQVYARLFEQYRGKSITFIEVGVYNGGSLFMWRDYFGPKARIIGVEFNPLAKKWEKDGFEIYIGNQADPQFWTSLFNKIGCVDIVLDDGGHTNQQQIVTCDQCIPKIRNGGMMIVEDVHSSYMTRFGNPSKYSFIEWAKKLVNDVNSRFDGLSIKPSNMKNYVYSIEFFESIVCFKVDRDLCLNGVPTTNSGITSSAVDFRHEDSLLSKVRLKSRLIYYIVMWFENIKLKKFF